MREMVQKLKDCQEKVVRPALTELSVYEELHRRITAKYDQNLEHLKEISSIVRIPAMTNEFYKLMRAREKDKALAAAQKKSIKQMVDWNVTDAKS